MKILLHGCAFAALALGLVGQATAQIEVRPSPIHTIPDTEDQGSPSLPLSAAPELEAKMEARALASNAAGSTAPETAAPEAAAPESRPAESLTIVAQEAEPLDPQETAFFVALGHRVTDAAAAYEAYVRTASAIDARFQDGQEVQRALKVGSSYNPLQLQEGVIAYSAVLALRTQSFVDGVKAQGQPWMVERLIADPDVVMQIHGADEAAADVSGVLRAQSQALMTAGRSIGQAAYDVQHQAWSRGAVPEPEKVLASAKASAIKIAAADVKAERRLLLSIGAAPSSNASGGRPSEAVIRGLALAAVAVLGHAGDAEEPRFESLLSEAASAECLQMSKLNLNQCLAVAGPHYEDVFCLGRHAVSETAQCLISAVDNGGSATLVQARAPEGRLADDEGYGSERAEAYAPPPAAYAQPDRGARDLVSR